MTETGQLTVLIGAWKGEISGKPTEFILWENQQSASHLIGILIWGECISTLELTKVSKTSQPGLEIDDKLRLSSNEYIFSLREALSGSRENRLRVDDDRCSDRRFWKEALFDKQYFVSNEEQDQLRITKFPYRFLSNNIFRREKPSARSAKALKDASINSDLPALQSALTAICNPSISYSDRQETGTATNSARYCPLKPADLTEK